MKKFSLFALALVSLFLGNAHAQAAQYAPLGTLTTETSGVIDEANGNFYDGGEGQLGTDLSIIFTYNLSQNPTSKSIIVTTVDGDKTSSSDLDLLTDSYHLTIEKTSSSVDGYVSAFIVTITNLTSDLLDFKTVLKIIASNPTYSGNVYTTWQTASSVPLPAALPLFGLGLAGLAGYKRSRRKA